MRNKAIEVKTFHGKDMTVTIQSELIMVHSEDISMQWPLNGVGVLVIPVLDAEYPIRLAFMSGISYQSFHIEHRFYDQLREFFRTAGFPMPEPVNATSENFVNV